MPPGTLSSLQSAGSFRGPTLSAVLGVALSKEMGPLQALPRAAASSRTAKMLTVMRGSIAHRMRDRPRAAVVAVQLPLEVSHARAHRGIRRLPLTLVLPG